MMQGVEWQMVRVSGFLQFILLMVRIVIQYFLFIYKNILNIIKDVYLKKKFFIFFILFESRLKIYENNVLL